MHDVRLAIHDRAESRSDDVVVAVKGKSRDARLVLTLGEYRATSESLSGRRLIVVGNGTCLSLGVF